MKSKKLVVAGLALLAMVMMLAGCDTTAGGGADTGAGNWSPAEAISKITSDGTHTLVVPQGYTNMAAIKTALKELDKRNEANTSTILINLDLSKTGITSIESYAFQDCECLVDVTLPPTVSSIGYFAFRSCGKLTKVVIPARVTIIESEAFSACWKLSSVKVEAGSLLATIETLAFAYCQGLKTIDIPASVTSIGASAFRTTTLKTVNYSGTKAQWDELVAEGIDPYENEHLLNATIICSDTSDTVQ